MLSRLVSDSLRRGVERLTGARISGVGGTSDRGSKTGSDGEDDVESTIVGSVVVDGDASLVASDFFNLKNRRNEDDFRSI